MKLKMVLSSLLLCTMNEFSYSLPIDLGKGDLATNKIRIVVADDTTARQKILDNLKAELGNLEPKWKEYAEQFQKKIVDTRQQIDVLKREPGHNRSTDINAKKIAQLNKLSQVLHDIKETRRQLIEIVKQHIEFWEKYFSNVGKSVERIEDKSLYTFTDLQRITKKIALDEEQRIALVAKKEEDDGMRRRQELLVSSKDRDIRHIEKEIEDFKKQHAEYRDIKGEITLLDLEKEVAHKERELAELRIELHQKDEDLCDSKLLVMQEVLKVLREDMLTIRSRIHIDRAEVFVYEQKNNEVRREVASQKARLTEQKNKILLEKSAAQEKLDILSNRYNIALSNMRQIQDWEIDADTVPEMYAAYAVSYEQTKIALADRLLQKINVELAIEDARLERAQVVYDTVKSLYGITQGLFRNNDYLERERGLLKELRQSIAASIKKDSGEVTAAHNYIKEQYKAVANVKKHQEKTKALLTKTGTTQQRKIEESQQLLTSAAQKLESQKDVSLQVSELYTKLSDLKEETVENINFMLQELDLIGVWHRAINAVTWDGIKNIGPNLRLFAQSVMTTISSYINHFSVSAIVYKCGAMSFTELFLFFLLIFGLFLLFVVLKSSLPSMYKTLMVANIEQRSVFIFNRYIAVLLGFCILVFNQLFCWLTFLLLSSWYKYSVAIMLIFYTYSIVFWIYALRIFMQQFLIINRRSDYVLLNKRLVDRFYFVFSFFFISTIVILFFRKMFMLVMTYQQSEFPNILLRIYHVVVFISIILSIDKEEVLQLLPSKTRLGQKISSLVQRYYYALLLLILGLLVMSDPYLGGYGSLMWHIFWTSLFTIAILIFLFFLHKLVGRYTKVFFFQDDDVSEGSIERFENAKAWYGVYVVSLFFVFLLIAGIICSNLWGYGFTLRSVKVFLHYELPWQIESWGKIVSLKVIDLVRMCLSVLFGFLSAYLCRRFILDKIFEIHYVDPGVQNTITIISRYVIIFISFLVGFAQAGLGNVITYILGFGLLALAWAFKDLFTDFFAYFFILVQRPVKLGDYVRIDESTVGVVRKISPRTVILRRKNAVNIVVPNSTVLKASLYNWNYTRSYIGFDDITFSVPFGTDIQLVRDILFKILDEDQDVLKMPQPLVRLDGFSDKGYEFMVRGFLSSGNTLRQWDIASNIRFAIVAKLAEKGIQVAAPVLGITWQQKSGKQMQDMPPLDRQ